MSSIPSRLNSPFVKAVLWLGTGVALASAAFLAVQARRNDYSAANMVLQTYNVSPVLENPLRLALQYTLDGQAKIIQTGVGGQLLISAQQRVHDQIPTLLASFGNQASEAPTLSFDLWYVVASDGPPNLDEPDLRSIRATLEKIVEVEGPKRFEIRQRKGLRVQVGADAEAGPILEAVRSPRLLKRKDGTEVIVADLDLGIERNEKLTPSTTFFSNLKTRVELVPGETMVVGQTARRGERYETLYQILRASR